MRGRFSYLQIIALLALELAEFDVMLGVRDMSKVQGPDERNQGTHLPQAAEVEMSAMRQSQDAEAKISYRYSFITPAKLASKSLPQRSTLPRSPFRDR